MIQKLIFISLFFIAFNDSFAQKQEVYSLSFPNQKLNPDSLRADCIKRIGAFPEYFRSYARELGNPESKPEQIVRIKRDYKYSGDYQIMFVREFLDPLNSLPFGTPISTDTLLLNDSIREKFDHIIRHENYFGFTNGKLTSAEQLTIKQLENITAHTFVSADRKAVLFYESADSKWQGEAYPVLYYYYEGMLVAVRISDLIYTTETELSQFSNMKFLPGMVTLIFELEEYIKK